MEVNKKLPYEVPTVEFVNVCSEGVICQSGFGNRNPYSPDDSNPFGN